MSDVSLGFRRRCGWCGVQLRWWQLNMCSKCHGAEISQASAPCREGSRWDAYPDRVVMHVSSSESSSAPSGAGERAYGTVTRKIDVELSTPTLGERHDYR